MSRRVSSLHRRVSHLVKDFEIVEHEEGRQHDDSGHGLDGVDEACVFCAFKRQHVHHILWTQQQLAAVCYLQALIVGK